MERNACAPLARQHDLQVRIARKRIELTVNAKPALDGARRVVVEALEDEERLRQLDWVERNRRRVDERSGGKVGYVYVQDTGIGGQTHLVDGGIVTVPTFAIYSREGDWIIENRGVEPDIEVLDDLALMQDGADPQLVRGIDVLMKQLEQSPPSRPQRPAYAKR